MLEFAVKKPCIVSAGSLELVAVAIKAAEDKDFTPGMGMSMSCLDLKCLFNSRWLEYLAKASEG